MSPELSYLYSVDVIVDRGVHMSWTASLFQGLRHLASGVPTGSSGKCPDACILLVMLVMFLMATAVKAQDRVPDFSDRSRFLNEKRISPSPESTPAPLQMNASEAAVTNVTSDVPFVSSLAHLSSTLSSVWDLRIEDERIDVALMRWTSSLGYGFRWDADRYFPIVAPTHFHGTYEESLTRLLMSPGILSSNYPLEACIYANDPPLVRITRMGDQTQECR